MEFSTLFFDGFLRRLDTFEYLLNIMQVLVVYGRGVSAVNCGTCRP